MRARTTSGRIVRLALAALILFGPFMVLMTRIPVWILFVNFLPVILIALPLLAYVFWPTRRTTSQTRESGEKPKHGESLSELMSILNDDDIEDLSVRVKQRLAEQIDGADPDEIETFENLLDETKRKRS